jgi:hypothetical protein
MISAGLHKARIAPLRGSAAAELANEAASVGVTHERIGVATASALS